MRKPSVAPLLLALLAALSFSRASLAADKQVDFCNLIATDLLQDPTLLTTNVTDIINNPSCFIQANISNPLANVLIAPARTSLWNTFESLSGSQQQGSSLSSTGSTNAVSKPSGPSALVQEFGGANATTSASASTIQWAPGTMFTNLAVTGVDYLCFEKNVPKGCISPGLLKGLAPLTIKVTANTGGGQTATGTATTPTSPSTSQPVTVSSKGTSGPGFAGLTVQYSFFGSKSKAAATALTGKTAPSTKDKDSKAPSAKDKDAKTAATDSSAIVSYYATELKAANRSHAALENCDVYSSWQSSAQVDLSQRISKTAVSSPSSDQVREIQWAIQNQYATLLTNMLKSKSCAPAIEKLGAMLGAMLEAETYEDFASQQKTSKTPELALEYDLNTPQNKPGYSSVKGAFTWSFGAPKKPVPGKPTGDGKDTNAEQSGIRSYAKTQATVAASAGSGASVQAGKQASANAKPQAKANVSPWSLTMNGNADFYNSQPPSSVPSANRVRELQFGSELSYLFTPSGNSGALHSLIGPFTAAAAYSYQDQTSPAMFTGPALTGFTGLPASTTTAYTQRGVIHLGQVRLNLGTGSNLTCPLAFTYSNRSELVVHPTWGVQFGVSYNLTSLFNSFGSSKSGSSEGGS
jgi:hypothetical protein